MLNNILSILDRLGSYTQNRAIHITLSNSLLNTKVVLQRIDGYQGLNEGQSAELICLATDPYIELKQFIGCQVAIDQVQIRGSYLEPQELLQVQVRDSLMVHFHFLG